MDWVPFLTEGDRRWEPPRCSQEGTVPKSNKFSSKVPALSDLEAKWVNEDGEVDVEAAKKAMHTLMVDKAKAQDAREDALEDAKEVTAERDDLKTKLESKADPDLKAELDKANDAKSKAESERDEAVNKLDRLEIATEKGLTPAQAKRLVGKDREELEADADELVKDLGIKPKGEEEDPEDEGAGTRPTSRVKLNNPGDTGGNAGVTDPDHFEKVAAQIGGGFNF